MWSPKPRTRPSALPGLGATTIAVEAAIKRADLVIGLNPAGDIEDEIVNDTLNVILKYEGDVKKAQGELSKLIEQKSAEAAGKGPHSRRRAQSEAKKGVLH